jgi:hypothetical protein
VIFQFCPQTRGVEYNETSIIFNHLQMVSFLYSYMLVRVADPGGLFWRPLSESLPKQISRYLSSEVIFTKTCFRKLTGKQISSNTVTIPVTGFCYNKKVRSGSLLKTRNPDSAPHFGIRILSGCGSEILRLGYCRINRKRIFIKQKR